jgi:hypothetical protein
MLKDQFAPTTQPWACGTIAAKGRFDAFLTSFACGWDGAHYLWLAEMGYTPTNIGVPVVVTEKGPLALQFTFKESPPRFPQIEAIPNIPQVNLDGLFVGGFDDKKMPKNISLAKKSGSIRSGSKIYSLNGEPTPYNDGKALSKLLKTRPLELRTFHQTDLVQKEAVFFPVFPRLILGPMLALAEQIGAPMGLALFAKRLVAVVVPFLVACVGFVLSVLARNRTVLGRNSGSMSASAMLLLAFPSAYFFSVPYSEAAFFTVSAAWLYALGERNMVLAAAVGFLLPLTRGIGAFAVFPALAYACKACASPEFKPRSVFAAAKLLLVVGAPGLGYVTYFLGMFSQLGDPFAGMQFQANFVAEFSVSNLANPLILFKEMLGRTELEFHHPVDSVLDRMVFCVCCVLLVMTFKRLPLHVWMYSFFSVMIPPMSGSFMSFTRFALTGAYPLLWPFVESLAARGSGGTEASDKTIAVTPAILNFLYVVGVSVQCSLVLRFLKLEWAG